MEMKISLDMLTSDSVSVKKQEYTDKGKPVGKPHRKLYQNSVKGRQKIEEDLEENYKSSVFLIWGDKPTVDNDVTA